MSMSSASIDSPASASTIAGKPNATAMSAPARADRSRAMRSRTASSLLKRSAFNEFRYSFSDFDSTRFGEAQGTVKVAVATRGLPRASSQLIS